MDSVIRAVAVYFFLLLVIRLSGRRTLGELDTFDFVLLLIISEMCQQALVGQDFSIMGAWVGITVLVGLDILMAIVKSRSKTFEKILEGVPSMLIEDGKVLHGEIKKARLDEDDIREAARSQLGLSKLSQIRHAVLEKNGSISIVPWERIYTVSLDRAENDKPSSREMPLPAT